MIKDYEDHEEPLEMPSKKERFSAYCVIGSIGIVFVVVIISLLLK